MRRLIIYPDAEAEMIEAAAYYGRQQKNLSMRFLAAVQDAYTRVRINPTLYPLLDIEVRRCLIRVFPYAVISG